MAAEEVTTSNFAEVFYKKTILKISPNAQESTCKAVFFVYHRLQQEYFLTFAKFFRAAFCKQHRYWLLLI